MTKTNKSTGRTRTWDSPPSVKDSILKNEETPPLGRLLEGVAKHSVDPRSLEAPNRDTWHGVTNDIIKAAVAWAHQQRAAQQLRE